MRTPRPRDLGPELDWRLLALLAVLLAALDAALLLEPPLEGEQQRGERDWDTVVLSAARARQMQYIAILEMADIDKT